MDIHVIIPSHCVMDSSPFKKPKFHERTIEWPKFLQKNFKNSVSGRGLGVFVIVFSVEDAFL